MEYGKAPEERGFWDLKFEEYMHYMYLPIMIPENPHKIMIPDNLNFADEMILKTVEDELIDGNGNFSHVYVTARRGYATPGNPLNRPGWHSDGFGTNDVNYVWTDRFPTLFAVGDFGTISEDHVESSVQFDRRSQWPSVKQVTYRDKELLRLDPSVIHTAPPIPAPGGERSFFKISFSNERYNLKGNAHNHLLDYEWPMYDRQAARNDPAHAEVDGKKEEK